MVRKKNSRFSCEDAQNDVKNQTVVWKIRQLRVCVCVCVRARVCLLKPKVEKMNHL